MRELVLRYLALTAAVMAGGAALGLAHQPIHYGFLVWVAFLALFWALEDSGVVLAFALGTTFGATANAAGMPGILDFVGKFLKVGPFEAFAWFTVLCHLSGLKWGVAAAAAAVVPPGPRRRVALVCALVAAERYLPSMFPNELSMTVLDFPAMVQSTSVFGPGALCLLIVAANAALWECLRRPGRRAYALAGGVGTLLLANAVWGGFEAARWDAPTGGRRLAAGVVQGGVEPESAGHMDHVTVDMEAYVRLTSSAAASGAQDLVVWPESSFPDRLDYDRRDPAAATAIGLPLPALFARVKTPGVFLANGVGRAQDRRLRSLSLLVGPDKRPLAFVEKTVLTPFGEYMPLGRQFPFLYRISPRTGHRVRGRATAPLKLPGGGTLGVMICYEDFYPDVALRLARQGADVLSTQSNDSWVDGSSGPEMHMTLSRLRAVQTRRAVLHAAKTGVSAIISPSGRVLARVENGVEGFATASVPLAEGLPPAAWLHPWPFRACLALLAILIGLAVLPAVPKGRSMGEAP